MNIRQFREWMQRKRRERRMQRVARAGQTIWVAHCAEKRRWHAQVSHQHMHREDGVVNSDVSICDANGIARALAALVPSDGLAHPVVMSLSRGVGVPVTLEEVGGRPGRDRAARRVPDGFASILDEVATPPNDALWQWTQEPTEGALRANEPDGRIMMRYTAQDTTDNPSARAAAQAAALTGRAMAITRREVEAAQNLQGPMVRFDPVFQGGVPFRGDADEIAEQGPQAANGIGGCPCTDCAAAMAEIREEAVTF